MTGAYIFHSPLAKAGMYGEWIFMGYNICKIISEKTFVLVTENFLNRGDFSCARAGVDECLNEEMVELGGFNICLVVNCILPASGSVCFAFSLFLQSSTL